MCCECHSARDPQGNIVVGTKFKGGPMPVRPTWSGDWPIQIPRIAGLPGYTDELAMRLLTQGAIRWDGKQLRAPMPRFRMSPQDAADVIAYLRSLYSARAGPFGRPRRSRRCFRRRDRHIHPRRAAHDSQRGGDVDRLAREHAMQIVDARDRGR